MIERRSVPEPVLRYLDAWRKGDPLARAAQLADGFVFSGPLVRIEGDLPGAQSLFARESARWGDRDYALTHRVGSGDHLAIGYRCTMTGLEGEDAGVAVQLPVTAFVRIDGNRIGAWRELFDTAVFARARKAAAAGRGSMQKGSA